MGFKNQLNYFYTFYTPYSYYLLVEKTVKFLDFLISDTRRT